MQARPGIVNERVNFTMTLEGCLRDSADITAVGDIGGDGQRSAEVGAERRKAIRPPRREDRMGARAIEQPGGGRADSRRGAGDDHNGAGQVKRIHSRIVARGPRAGRSRAAESAGPPAGGA
jgi:hypothetical protein